MTAPAGLTRLAPPPSLLSPAPSATLSPPLSEPDQQRTADAGGRLSFFGRDGHVLLELSHGPLEAWERQKRWVAVSRKPFWPPVTVAAPVGNISAQHAVGQSCQPSPRPAEPAGRKQPIPGRRVAGALSCRGRDRGRRPAPVPGGLSPACLRRLSRRPCRAARPADGPQLAPSAGTPTRRAARLADAVHRLAERREQRAAVHAHRSSTAAARPATPRKRSQASGRAAGSTPRPSPAAHRQSTVHSIDSLLSTQGRAAPPQPPPLVVPTPVRPSPYAAYAAYLAGGAGELCAVPPPAGCAPLPSLSPLLLARLSGAGGGGLLTVQTRPSPAHSAAGWHAVAYDYSQSSDEPLNLSTR